MANLLLIKVTDLTTLCLTRLRGKEAFDKLRPILEKHGSIDLDLDSTDAPSSSFLDQIILKLQGSDLLDRVTFVTKKDRIKRRLSSIAGTRTVNLHFKPEPSAVRRLIPKIISDHEAEYEKKPLSV